MRKPWFFFGAMVLWGTLIAQTGFAGGQSHDYLLFCQTINDDKKAGPNETIYLYQADSSEMQQVATGKNITVSVGSNWLLYYMGGQLFYYRLQEHTTQMLARIDAEEVSAQVLPGETEQALVVTHEDGIVRWYILDLKDGSMRPIARPPAGSSSGSLETGSPNGNYTARLHSVALSSRIGLEIRKQASKNSQVIWRLPQELTALPEKPLWAPDSQNIAFYAKKSDSSEGFYSLYLFHPETLKLNVVAHQVFNKILFETLRSGPFYPSWTHDGRYLLYIDQPFGLPTESAIIKYDTKTDKKNSITSNKWNFQYPSWSPSDRFISVLVSRSGSDNQLYIMNPNGEGLQKISPDKGYCTWAQWVSD